MPQIDYFIVDVFTQKALAGNPLAVVMNTCCPDNRADAGDCARVQSLRDHLY